MTFTVRSFDDAAATFREGHEGQLFEHQGQHYASLKCLSTIDKGGWSEDPPENTLALLPGEEIDAADASTFVERLNFGGAVGTWNANGAGQWLLRKGSYAIADIHLTQEQADEDGFEDEGASGDHVSLLFAQWKVTEGLATAIWRTNDRALLTKIMGLPGWPEEGWTSCEVWYGE